jgi:outer membrane protein TolC
MIKPITLAFLLLTTASLSRAQGDSVRVLSEDVFIAAVKQFHPVAKQGRLLVEMAQAELMAIRGNFDPVVTVNNNSKTLEGKRYYNYSNGELTIPTWYGVEVRSGYERNFGDLISNELTPGRSSYMGITVPLAKNLLLDKRRAALQQAKLFTSQSEQERRIVVNDLLRDAYTAYWNWSKDYQIYSLWRNAVKLNEERLRLIRISYEQGDRAKIDSIEAEAQLQTLQQQEAEAWLKYRKSSLDLSNFLWTEEVEPAYISERVIPDSLWTGMNISALPINPVDEWLNQWVEKHPKLQSLKLKTSGLEIERRLKFQNLLPKADLKYNFLQKGYEPWKNVNTVLFDNNYKIGFAFSVPLFLRQGRGEWKAAKLKVQNMNLEIQETELEIENKIRYHYNELTNLQQQSGYLQNAYSNYTQLFKAEELKFSLGETTLFLLNTRQNQLLSSRQKLLEVKAKFFLAQASLQWAAGQLQ